MPDGVADQVGYHPLEQLRVPGCLGRAEFRVDGQLQPRGFEVLGAHLHLGVLLDVVALLAARLGLLGQPRQALGVEGALPRVDVQIVGVDQASVDVEQGGADAALRVQWQTLILCTGARERLLPFPGWTLPGVTGAGGLQALINMAVNVQIAPSKGMTLPFISYGGSSMLALSIGMGLLLAFTRRNPYLTRSPYVVKWSGDLPQ